MPLIDDLEVSVLRDAHERLKRAGRRVVKVVAVDADRIAYINVNRRARTQYVGDTGKLLADVPGWPVPGGKPHGSH